MRPPSNRRPAKASVYAVSIHWRLAVEMCSAFCAEGRAMMTTEASSTTISCAMAMTPRARKRLGSRGASVPSSVLAMAAPGSWSGKSRVEVIAVSVSWWWVVRLVLRFQFRSGPPTPSHLDLF